jgi:hypothetical protein
MEKDAERLFAGSNVANIRGLRKRNLPYLFIWVIYYAWVVAFASWWTASPLSEHVFGPGLKNLLSAMNVVSSVVAVLIIRKEWFVKTARIGAALLIVGMSVFLLGQNAGIQLTAALLIAMALGVVNISILWPFIFVLNNTEKLCAVVGSNILLGLIGLFLESAAGNSLQNHQKLLLSFAILIIALSFTLFFQKGCLTGDAHDKGTTAPEFHPRLYLTLLFSCVFILLYKGFGKGMLNLTAESFSHPLLLWYYAGGLLGGVIYFIVYARSPRSIHVAVNIIFGLWPLGLLCNALADRKSVV